MVYYIILLLNLLLITSSIHFTMILKNKDVRCFEDSIGKNVLVAGSIESDNPNYAFTIKLPNKKADSIIHYSNNELKTKFSFTTNSTASKYHFCLQNLANLNIEFNYTYTTVQKIGAEAMDYTILAQKDDIKPIEVEINKLNNIVNNIEVYMTIFFIMLPQKYQKDISEKQLTRIDIVSVLSSKLIYFSALTLGLMILANIFQTQKLKKFFKAKKLI